MKHNSLLSAVAVLLLFLASCKNSGTKGLVVPKDASIAVHINGSSINSKLSWDEIKQSEAFKKHYAEEKDEFKKKLMDNPEASGVDIKSDFVYFMKREGSGSYGAFEGNLKDAAAFEKTNTEFQKGAKVEKDGDLSYIRMKDDGSIVSWNKSKFFVVSNADANMASNHMGHEGMSFGDSTMAPVTNKISTDSLVIIAKSLLTVKKDHTLEDDDRFASLLKENGDIHMWMNTEQLYAGQAPQMLSMMKAGDLLKGNISASTINFDNGKVDMKSKTYVSKDIANLFKEHAPVPVSNDVFNKIPSQDLLATFVLNFPSEGLKAFLQVSGMDGFANMMLSKFKITVDEFINAYKGETIFAVTDNPMPAMTDTAAMSNPAAMGGPNFIFAMAVKDRLSFQKIMDVANNTLFKDPAVGSKVTMKLNDQWFTLGSSTTTVDQFIAGGGTAPAFTSKISGHPFGGYIDLKRIMGSRMVNPMGHMGQPADSTFQDVVMTGGEYTNGAIVMNMQLNLTDQSTNSLKQLFKYMSTKMKSVAEGEPGDFENKNNQVLVPGDPDTSTVKPH